MIEILIACNVKFILHGCTRLSELINSTASTVDVSIANVMPDNTIPSVLSWGGVSKRTLKLFQSSLQQQQRYAVFILGSKVSRTEDDLPWVSDSFAYLSQPHSDNLVKCPLGIHKLKKMLVHLKCNDEKFFFSGRLLTSLVKMTTNRKFVHTNGHLWPDIVHWPAVIIILININIIFSVTVPITTQRMLIHTWEAFKVNSRKTSPQILSLAELLPRGYQQAVVSSVKNASGIWIRPMKSSRLRVS